MMGFAGQLSLGHSLYVGLGAYAAAALYVHFGVSPWIGLGASIALCARQAASSASSPSASASAGSTSAILTIAFAEFARIGFDHFTWVRGSSGLFLPVASYAANDLWNLRGSPGMFYYVMLALTVGAFLLCHALLRSPHGLLLAGDPRESRGGAGARRQSLPLQDDGVVLSAAMTSLAGVVFAFYYNNLFPEQIFHISRSIELILGTDHRRHRHAARAAGGRVAAHGLAEGMRRLMLRTGHRRTRREAGVLRLVPAGRRRVSSRRRVAAARSRALRL